MATCYFPDLSDIGWLGLDPAIFLSAGLSPPLA